jgi:hypothetical protein
MCRDRTWKAKVNKSQKESSKMHKNELQKKNYIRMDMAEREDDPGGLQRLVWQRITFLWMHRFCPLHQNSGT